MAAGDPYRFLGQSKAAVRIREVDWAATPIGVADAWSDSLKSLLASMLRSAHPTLLMLGSQLIQLYNDAYVDQGMSRHPEQMGAPTAHTWPEIMDLLGPQFATVLREGKSALNEDRLVPTMRNGRLVNTCFTFSCSPFVDANGEVQGIVIVPIDVTQRMLQDTRQQSLSGMTEALARVTQPADVPGAVLEVLGRMAARDATKLRFVRSSHAAFEPSPCANARAEHDAVESYPELLRWMAAEPARWRRLQDGQHVGGENFWAVPLPVLQGAEAMRLLVFELAPRIPFDDAYEQYLLDIAQRVSQAYERIEVELARAHHARERDTLLMQAPIATAVMTGPDLVFTLTNDLYLRHVGKQDLIGKTFEQGFPELVKTALPDLLHSVYRSGVPYVSPESRILLDRHGDGQLEECYFQFNLHPMRTLDGDVHELTVVAVELTEQVRARHEVSVWHTERQAELQARAEQLEETVRARTLSLQQVNTAMAATHDALKRAAEFNRHVTEMVPGRIAYWDADMRCRFANGLFCEWVGRPLAEVIGMTGVELFSAAVIARVQHHIEGVMAGVPQRFETQGLRPDGTAFHNQINYVPERAGAGERSGFYLMAIDITPLKEAEIALRLANADLGRARDEAEAASRMKSAFLANMSHEIRTPLNAILGMTHILSRRIGDAAQREQLAKVDSAARHLLGLISDVLDLSKIEAGKMVLERNDFATSEVTDWAVEMVRGAASAKQLLLVNEATGLPTSLKGDSLRLSQILINLLSNAVKFTERGSVTLRGRVLQTSGGRHQLRFEVEDTGIGISPATQASLFGAFEQADSSITRRHGGTGLGLALSRQLARAMGGDAGVQSQPGVGSSFWFTVWLEQADATPAAVQPGTGAATPPLTMAELEAKVRALHGGQRILVAEDNPVNREVALALLENVGLTVITAHDGEQAIARVKAEPFDLVLMDMQMPNVDGLEATRAIRADMHALPIVAMTANAFVSDRHACLEAGMDDHLAKPVSPGLLYGMLLRWLPSTADRGRTRGGR